MGRIPQPYCFCQGGDLLTDSLVSCVDDGFTLVCRAMLPRAISAELASRIGFVGWQDCFSVEPAVAVCDHRFAVAVGLCSRARVRRTETRGTGFGKSLEFFGESALDRFSIIRGQLVLER